MRLHEHPLLCLGRTAPHQSEVAPPAPFHRLPSPSLHPQRARQVSIPAIVLCCVGIVWVVAYASDRYESAKAKRIADGFKAMQAAAVADDSSLGGAIQSQLEEKFEQDLWSKPASCAAGARRRPSAWSDISRVCATIRPADYDDSMVRGDVAFYQAAVARIDWRLKQLGSKD